LLRDAAVAATRTALSGAAWAAGQALTLEQAVEEALAFEADSPAPERRGSRA
jgi:hypothetical protein